MRLGAQEPSVKSSCVTQHRISEPEVAAGIDLPSQRSRASITRIRLAKAGGAGFPSALKLASNRAGRTAYRQWPLEGTLRGLTWPLTLLNWVVRLAGAEWLGWFTQTSCSIRPIGSLDVPVQSKPMVHSRGVFYLELWFIPINVLSLDLVHSTPVFYLASWFTHAPCSIVDNGYLIFASQSSCNPSNKSRFGGLIMCAWPKCSTA